MFHVLRFDEFPGPSVTVGLFDTKAEAEAEARRLAAEFQRQGFDGKQGYWWGRNEGEKAVRFLVQAK